MIAEGDGAFTAFPLPHPCPEVLGLGAFLKNSVCAIKGKTAYLSSPIGNLDSAAAITAFEETVARVTDRFDLHPVLYAHDLHPDFYSSRWAENREAPALAVQHHHAHIAAIALEYGVEGPILGLALDGFGLGPGDESWGGELLRVSGSGYERLGHLAHLPQPGGDVAAREPWRMAAAALHRLGRGDEIARRFAAFPAAARLETILTRALNCPPTSSAGRLFDAACGLLGVHPVATFEGEAPMALEAMATAPRILPGGWCLDKGVLDLLPLLETLIDRPAEEGANLFHGTLIAALAAWAEAAAEQTDLRTVALGGGCLLNKVLSQGLTDALLAKGLRPLLPRRASPGDTAVALGQAWVAACAASRL